MHDAISKMGRSGEPSDIERQIETNFSMNHITRALASVGIAGNPNHRGNQERPPPTNQACSSPNPTGGSTLNAARGGGSNPPSLNGSRDAGTVDSAKEEPSCNSTCKMGGEPSPSATSGLEETETVDPAPGNETVDPAPTIVSNTSDAARADATKKEPSPSATSGSAGTETVDSAPGTETVDPAPTIVSNTSDAAGADTTKKEPLPSATSGSAETETVDPAPGTETVDPAPTNVSKNGGHDARKSENMQDTSNHRTTTSTRIVVNEKYGSPKADTKKVEEEVKTQCSYMKSNVSPAQSYTRITGNAKRGRNVAFLSDRGIASCDEESDASSETSATTSYSSYGTNLEYDLTNLEESDMDEQESKNKDKQDYEDNEQRLDENKDGQE